MRQRAIKVALEWILKCDERNCMERYNVAMLAAALIFMSNALCSRPLPGRKLEIIKWSVLPHQTAIGDPFCPFGLFFIRKISFLPNGCPIAPNLRGAEREIYYIYSFPTPRAYREFVSPDKVLLPKLPSYCCARKEQSHNKQIKTTEIDVDEDEQPLFNIDLDPNAIKLPQHLVDSAGEQIRDPNIIAMKLWLQLMNDMGQKMWQAQGKPPYINRTKAEYSNPERFFQGSELKRRFQCVGFKTKRGFVKEWNLVFEQIFPGFYKNFPNELQNFKTMTYFRQYMELHTACRNAEIRGEEWLKIFRAGLLQKYNTMAFMPYASSTRFFETRKSKCDETYPQSHTGTCPVIVLHPQKARQILRELKNEHYEHDSEDEVNVILDNNDEIEDSNNRMEEDSNNGMEDSDSGMEEGSNNEMEDDY